MVNTEYYKEEFDQGESEHIVIYNPRYEYIMNLNYIQIKNKNGKIRRRKSNNK